MESSGIKVNRKDPRSSWGSEKLSKFLEHLEDDQTYKPTMEEVRC